MPEKITDMARISIRGHSFRKTAEDLGLLKPEDRLHAYSRGDVRSDMAIRGADLDGFHGLMQAMDRLNLPLPKGKGREAA